MSTFLGIEFGSTRIKSMLIGQRGAPLAQGAFDWENRYVNGVWTYTMDEVKRGLQASFSDLVSDYKKNHSASLPEISGIGISAMMHGYLVLDKDDNLLTDFRTWRNTITEESSVYLTRTFGFNIPQRWSIAHLHHAIVGKENHVKDIAHMTTLAGYVHYILTGEKVVGMNEASGIFPIDSAVNDYNAVMIKQFDDITAEYDIPWRLRDIMPKALLAGDKAGVLTESGAKYLDPTGLICPGIPLCPPEGDAGTGMIATNSVAPLTGNVSAGTSVFATIVLEKPLSKLHPDIDILTTPTGKPAAMAHCGNCTSDLDAWVDLFREALVKMGAQPDKTELYRTLYNTALEGDLDCGGLVSVNYLSGEHITGFHEGRPLFARTPDSSFTLENFMRNLLFSSMATLRIGMDILIKDEGVVLSKLLGHGGLFKTPVVGQKLLAGALNVPIAVMESAGEGGAWGIALLAVYAVCAEKDETLEDFLESKIFSGSAVSVIAPDSADVEGFDAYMKRYLGALNVERAAVENLKTGK